MSNEEIINEISRTGIGEDVATLLVSEIQHQIANGEAPLTAIYTVLADWEARYTYDN